MNENKTQVTEGYCHFCAAPVRGNLPLQDDYSTVILCRHCNGYIYFVRKNGKLHKISWTKPIECCKARDLFAQVHVYDSGEYLSIICKSCDHEEHPIEEDERIEP